MQTVGEGVKKSPAAFKRRRVPSSRGRAFFHRAVSLNPHGVAVKIRAFRRLRKSPEKLDADSVENPVYRKGKACYTRPIRAGGSRRTGVETFMRMRKKKNLIPRMERCAAKRIANPEARRGEWRALMPSAKEICLELGCGKGRFTAGIAAAMPDSLFIGVEVVREALVVAMERCLDVPNACFISGNADALPQYFAPGEADKIYLNFSDPWPGNRHAKRRLTHGNFLKRYRQVLRDGGQLLFKTDNVDLFDFSLQELPRYGFALSEVTRNLHENGPVGIMTDYEEKFYAQGKPICRLVGTMEPWEEPTTETTKHPQPDAEDAEESTERGEESEELTERKEG